mmetsp:Transcript_7027/g.43125  ORF Transcript_7027/g.43125 Transcript_7027/m.43125 type:complete len:214 (+) Transcript_7027:2636-3277(+)
MTRSIFASIVHHDHFPFESRLHRLSFLQVLQGLSQHASDPLSFVVRRHHHGEFFLRLLEDRRQVHASFPRRFGSHFGAQCIFGFVQGRHPSPRFSQQDRCTHHHDRDRHQASMHGIVRRRHRHVRSVRRRASGPVGRATDPSRKGGHWGIRKRGAHEGTKLEGLVQPAPGAPCNNFTEAAVVAMAVADVEWVGGAVPAGRGRASAGLALRFGF